MNKLCGHTKSLEIGYGYGAVSGWYDLGITYRCKRCYECLWFIDDFSTNFENEKKHNDNKRKENIKYKPKDKRIHPRPKNYIGKKRMHRELMVITRTKK
jgi:hypothetical protein